MKVKLLIILLFLQQLNLKALETDKHGFISKKSSILVTLESDTSSERKVAEYFWIDFSITKPSKHEQEMVAKFSRIKSVVESHRKTIVFDTHSYNIPENSDQLIRMHIIDQPIKFHLSNNKKVVGLTINREEILSKIEAKGIEQKYDLIFNTFLNTKTLTNFFDLVFDNSNTKQKKVNVKHIRSLNYHLRNQEIVKLTCQTILKPKTILSQPKRTIICGKLDILTKYKEVNFSVGKGSVDNYKFNNSAKLKNDYFKIVEYLQQPLEVSSFIRSAYPNTSTSYINTLTLCPLEPGDSIYLHIKEPDFAYKKGALQINIGNKPRLVQTFAYGKGALKVNISIKLRLLPTVDYDATEEEALTITRQNVATGLAIVENAKDSLSNWAYKHLKTSAYFISYNIL